MGIHYFIHASIIQSSCNLCTSLIHKMCAYFFNKKSIFCLSLRFLDIMPDERALIITALISFCHWEVRLIFSLMCFLTFLSLFFSIVFLIRHNNKLYFVTYKLTHVSNFTTEDYTTLRMKTEKIFEMRKDAEIY